MNPIMMFISCWIVQHGQLVESWHIEQQTTEEVCMQMTQIFSHGGSKAVITVRCGE